MLILHASTKKTNNNKEKLNTFLCVVCVCVLPYTNLCLTCLTCVCQPICLTCVCASVFDLFDVCVCQPMFDLFDMCVPAYV